MLGGTDDDWRTLGGSCRTNVTTTTWTAVYESFDVISPWLVGTFDNDTVDAKKTTHLIPDVANCNARGVDYMPVAWAGFSWSNWQDPPAPFNDRSRDGGKFLWQQAYNSKSAGANMLYLAMFDDVDEATALYKTTTTALDSPDY